MAHLHHKLPWNAMADAFVVEEFVHRKTGERRWRFASIDHKKLIYFAKAFEACLDEYTSFTEPPSINNKDKRKSWRIQGAVDSILFESSLTGLPGSRATLAQVLDENFGWAQSYPMGPRYTTGRALRLFIYLNLLVLGVPPDLHRLCVESIQRAYDDGNPDEWFPKNFWQCVGHLFDWNLRRNMHGLWWELRFNPMFDQTQMAMVKLVNRMLLRRLCQYNVLCSAVQKLDRRVDWTWIALACNELSTRPWHIKIMDAIDNQDRKETALRRKQPTMSRHDRVNQLFAGLVLFPCIQPCTPIVRTRQANRRARRWRM